MKAVLYVDLDGSLSPSDTLHESTLALLKRDPLAALRLPLWLLGGGKARLKDEIAARAGFDLSRLPLREELLALCRAARAEGREVVLATGASERLARPLAEQLGLFDAVLASTPTLNLTGERKLAAIRQHAAGRPFEYVGNERTDLVIWREAQAAVVCGPATLAAEAATLSTVSLHLPTETATPRTWLRAIRLHQWAKNGLVLLPAIPLLPTLVATQWLHLLLAFISFGLCASSVYLLNDMLDLDADRAHAAKRKRPLAAGLIALPKAAALAALLLLASLLLAFLGIGPVFGLVLLGYWALTNAYSFRLKRMAGLDVVTLALLYTMRLFAGAAAIAVKPSFWILAFSMFLFFALAVAKRAVELDRLSQAQGKGHAPGRGYGVADLPMITAQGVAASQIAVLVFALYINDSTAASHFRRPEALWAICPLLLLWVNRVWLFVARGQLNEDPVLFALRDRFSHVLVALAGVCVFLALVA